MAINGSRPPGRGEEMIFCERCGIQVLQPGLCIDCCDVLEVEHPVTTEEFARPDGRGYYVTSSRASGARLTPEEIERVGELTRRGLSATQIAHEVGITSRTVHRARHRLALGGGSTPRGGGHPRSRRDSRGPGRS